MGRSKRKAKLVNTNFVNNGLKTTKSGLVMRKMAWQKFEATQSTMLKDASPAIGSMIEDIRNDIVLGGDDDWSIGINVDHTSSDMTYKELADVVTSLQPKRGVSWQNRINASQAHWAALIPSLSDAYLMSKTSNPQCMPLHHPEPPENLNSTHIYVIDIFDGRSYEYIPQDPDETSTTIALLRSGYIPPTPVNPTVAISIRSLELLHGLMRSLLNFSVQSFARLLADLHCMSRNVVYQPYLRTQVALAFDAYYSIVRRVNTFVKHVMGHDKLDYCLKNSCPACHYQLHDEPEHLVEFIVTGDGNTSLLHLPHRYESDNRIFYSDYYLPRSEVDVFENTKKQNSTTGTNDPLPESCAGWKNSRPMPQTMKAGSLGVMDETGVFLVICRHGIVQFIMDMVRSGELAKYPVAAANKLVSTFGRNILFAYDIGCTFSVTLAHSAVSDAACQANFTSCTGSFHGVAHSFKKGVGIEDGEGNERAFSSSNGLAAVTHHASAYYQHFRIHLHFEKWDQDKYERLGNFLLGNHASAWTQIRKSMDILKVTKGIHPSFNVDRDCPLFLQQEKEYIMSLKSEPKDEQAKIEYLEALEHLEGAEMELQPLLSRLSVSPTSELAYQAQRACVRPDHHPRTGTDICYISFSSEEDNFLLSLPLAAQLESLSQSALPGSPIETDPVPLGLSSSEGSGSLDLESEQLSTLTA
ncbi:uncharacterized protein EI90DRAFT_3134060 [Cantharellus anzutake]|uniref:uncharacterized protein n=1 Tax=Cantharellus anzutake TaxID=1750568 RepID=UPI001908302C|nr:uncharacterized protein EI90DRAFT_3134060 [Cantharellus anzutake]KAF8317008.1 hypothetical protein EI90DRAFT_3134060 [Cantharellus anzutake]